MMEKQVRKGHRTRRGKRWLALLMCVCLIGTMVPIMPDGAIEVQAATNPGTKPSVSAFATKTQLMDGTFAPDESGEATNIGKLVFGKNSSGEAQEWYILGADSGVTADNTIIFAASPIATGQKFNSNSSRKTDSNLWSDCTYEGGENVTEVFANHYGASELRKALKGMADGSSTCYFTTAEQGLMNATTVKTLDQNNHKTYTTTDKLYALAADGYGESNKIIRAGTSDGTVLTKDSYWSNINDDNRFWLRSPYTDSTSSTDLVLFPSIGITFGGVGFVHTVQPASNLNLSSVLFASAATAASDPVLVGAISSDKAMTLRLDGKDKVIGTAYYDALKGVIVADKAADATGTVSLVVQGNDGTKDWYYSAPVGKRIVVTTKQIKDKLSLNTAPNLTNCKIWLETTSDNVAYAKMAETTETTETINIDTVNSVTVTDMKPVACTDFNNTASCTDTGISTTAPVITYTTLGENGEAEVKEKADWNTTYKATVTLATKIEGDTIYVFDDSVSVTIDGETLTDALTPNADGTLTVTREFTTEKRKITGVTALTVPETFTTYYGYDEYDASPIGGSNTELGGTATVTFEENVEPTTEVMDVTWTIANTGDAAYDKTPGAENTFRWAISASALTNYNAADCPGYDVNTGNITGTVTIKNKDATPVTITGTDGSIAYTGTTIDVSKYFTIDSNAGTKTYSLIIGEGGGTGEGSLAGSILTVTKIGDFKIKVETAANGIYAAGDATITLTVANGTIEYTATDYSGTYDGHVHGISVNVSNPEGTTVTYSTDGQNYNSDNPSFKDAGEYTVYYKITKDNYTTIADSKTVTISAKPITASVQAADKVYDGNVTATVTAAAETGIVGETLAISGLTGSFADKNAGDDKTVTVNASSVNVTGVEAGTSASNYSITYAPTTTASIAQKEVTVSWSNTQFTYDGNAHKPTASLVGVLDNDTCTVTVSGEQTDANEVGVTYTATASIDNSNYSIKEADKTTQFTISNASQTAPSLIGVNETIKGKADGKITGLTAEMEYRIETQSEEENESTDPFTKVTDAAMTFAPGTYEVRYAAKTNYNASAVTSVTISEGSMLQVTIPQTEDQIGYSLSVSGGALAWQGSTTLTFALKMGYSTLDNFAVKAEYTSGENTGGNVAITDNGDGTYTISNVTRDVKVTVEGVADITAPTAEIKIDTNSWNQFQDNVIFNKFFKNTKTVIITALDSVTENPTIQYLLSDNALTTQQLTSENVTWLNYEAAFSINANSKKIVYAKATDEAGNTIIVNSAGVVVYTDSAADTTMVNYVKNVTGDVNAHVILNGNTVADIKNGSDALRSGTDYTVDADGNITFKDEYLKTLTPSTYTLTVSYHPMGESYDEGNENEAPNITELSLTVKNPKLIGITQPAAITGLPNGTDKTAAALGLPATVTISTEDTSVTTAGVNWDLTNLASGSYDKSVLTEQSFTVKGTVTLPEGIANPDNVSLNVTVSVTVIAADIVEAPTVDVAAGTYTENKTVALTSGTTGAKIYYTTDGSEPALSGGDPSGTTQQYTAPIAVTGTEGQSITTTIKAIAVKSGMQDSGVVTFTYTIQVPVKEYTITATAGANGSISPSGTVAVTKGDNQTFAITANEGYVIDVLKVDHAVVSAAASYTFSNVTADHTIEVTFKQKTTSGGGSSSDSTAPIPVQPQPQIKDDKGNTGWTAIAKKIEEVIKDQMEGGTKKPVTIDMNGTTTVPKSVLDTVKGTDVTIVFEMGNGISWTINGKDVTNVTGDMKFGVKTNTNAIPVDIINRVTGERVNMQMSLEHEGAFGFTATLTLNVEAKHKGLYANLFYYNPKAQAGSEMEFICADEIDENGNADLMFNHASDYTIVIDKEPMQAEEPEGENPTTLETLVPKKGTLLTDSRTRMVYKVTKSDKENGTLQFVKTKDKKAKKIVVPSTVTLDGITYKVTSVAANALKNNRTVTTLTIGSNVKTIGKHAFYGCKNLKSITIKTTKLTSKNVGISAFKGINKKVVIKVPKSKCTSYIKLLKNKGVSSKVKIKK